jgi:eukaryotic-like serine/threonine-protein kinase
MYEEVTEGQVLAGKYRVERLLGEGGMGVVVAARHLQLDERVALKFMRPEALFNAEAVARFAREARAAVKIKSEHVARVTDVGTLENGAPYMVMEYLEGGDLLAWLKQQGRLPVEQAVEFVLQACEAIAEAHALGIVHRDLKPANLFVIRRPDGAWSVKVLDFGISKMTGVSGSGPDFGMTKTSAVMGSPHYMSPEQMRSVKDVDARSDIWALGVILYELLTGVTPFTGDSFPELVLKIATDAPAPLRNHAPDVSPALEQVVLRCLDKDPGTRFATVGELAVAVVEFAPRRGRLSVERISGVLKAAGMLASAMALPPSSNPVTPVDAGTAASWGKTAPGSSGNKRVLFASAAALAVAALAFGGYAASHRSAKEAASAESIPTAAAPMVASPALPAATPAATPVADAPVAASAPVVLPAALGAKPVPNRARSTRTVAGAKPAPPAKPPEPATAPSQKPKPGVKPNIFDDR